MKQEYVLYVVHSQTGGAQSKRSC